MQTHTKARQRRVWVAALLATLVVLSATASVNAAPRGTSTKSLTKKLGVVKRKTELLLKRVTALEAAAPIGGLKGPAGGVLTGTFPNPGLAASVVSSFNIADGTITSADVGLNTLTSANFADGSIQGSDIAPGGILSGNIGPDAVASPAIANGSILQEDLAAGSVGAPQLRGLVLEGGNRNSIGQHAAGTSAAVCPPGLLLISGGWEWEVPRPNLSIVFSKPNRGANLWEVRGYNNSDGDDALTAQAVCLSQ